MKQHRLSPSPISWIYGDMNLLAFPTPGPLGPRSRDVTNIDKGSVEVRCFGRQCE